MHAVLHRVRELGGETLSFAGPKLELPLYLPDNQDSICIAAKRIVDAVRRCDGLVISSAAYHGSISGTIKNVIDYLEELSGDDRKYLDGRAVGLISCAYGPQAIGTCLINLRTIVHSLRGWPTSIGVGINSQTTTFENGRCNDKSTQASIELLSQQLVDFADMQHWLRHRTLETESTALD
jgi:FMN reductase